MCVCVCVCVFKVNSHNKVYTRSLLTRVVYTRVDHTEWHYYIRVDYTLYGVQCHVLDNSAQHTTEPRGELKFNYSTTTIQYSYTLG